MLISLLALLATTLSTGIRASLAGGPVVLEGPTTLELALIGGGVILVYGVATRLIWRRPAAQRGAQLHLGSEAVHTSQQATNAADSLSDEPSRGAA